MLPDAELLFYPSTRNCLAWSDEGDLAVAAGDYVHILVPRWRAPGQLPDEDPWVHVQLRTNTFSQEEWPSFVPASFEDFSIGEEQSTSQVAALAWSPAGLAKHGRPVIAVLTTNLLLSIWAPTSDPKLYSNWRRVLVVNSAVNNESTASPESEGPKPSCRARSVAWAPICSQSSDIEPTITTRKRPKIFLLAIGIDDGSVHMMQISSPYTTGSSSSWEANDILILQAFEDDAHGTASPGGQINNDLPTLPDISSPKASLPEEGPPISKKTQWSLFSVAMASRHFVDYIELGPWELREDTSIKVKLRRNDGITIYVVLACSVNEHRTAQGTRTILRLADPQYSLTGTFSSSAFDNCHDLLSLSRSRRIVESINEEAPGIHEKIRQAQADFDRRHKLGGLVSSQLWGLGSFERFRAACFTLHPRRMLEYTIAAVERSTIAFCIDDTSQEKMTRFPWQAEAYDGNKDQNTLAKILGIVFRTESSESYILSAFSGQVVYAAACASMLLWDDQRTGRLRQAESALLKIQGVLGVVLRPELDLLHLIQTESLDKAVTTEKVEYATGRSIDDLNSPAAQNLFVICTICDEIIPWKNLDEAQCVNGHPFARCRLTFLAITEPGISKYCESCRREFLNEENFVGDEKQAVRDFERLTQMSDPGDVEIHDHDFDRLNDSQPPVQSASISNVEETSSMKGTLASKVFAQFPECPYCLYRYVG